MKTFKIIPALAIAASLSTALPLPSYAGAGEGTKQDDHAEPSLLGTVTVKAYEFTVRQEGKVEAGKEATFGLVLKKEDGAADPTAVRTWVGKEDGKGSVKAKTHTHGKAMEAHVDVPDPIPAGSKLWIEVEVGGEKFKGSLAFKS